MIVIWGSLGLAAVEEFPVLGFPAEPQSSLLTSKIPFAAEYLTSSKRVYTLIGFIYSELVFMDIEEVAYKRFATTQLP